MALKKKNELIKHINIKINERGTINNWLKRTIWNCSLETHSKLGTHSKSGTHSKLVLIVEVDE